MGNTCCQKPEEELALNTADTDRTEEEIIKDKYPHDSDPAFKRLKKKEKYQIKQLSSDNIIEE